MKWQKLQVCFKIRLSYKGQLFLCIKTPFLPILYIEDVILPQAITYLLLLPLIVFAPKGHSPRHLLRAVFFKQKKFGLNLLQPKL